MHKYIICMYICFTFHFHGNPLQCSCLENLRDGGAWLAAVYGVAQSQTRLKRLSSSSSSSVYKHEASQVALVVKSPSVSAGHARDAGLTPGSERSPRGEYGNPLQFSCLEKPTDRRGWRATVHRGTKSWTQMKWFSMHSYIYINIHISIFLLQEQYTFDMFAVKKKKKNGTY